MKWTCRRCGLQRDDRRGSNCSDVKGQAHDWMETEDFLKGFSQHLWEKWLETADGENFTKEKKRIEDEHKQSTTPLQNSDVILQQKYHSNRSAFFREKKKPFAIWLIIISIVFAFLFKSFLFVLCFSLIAGIMWLVFSILGKKHFNKAMDLLDEYAKMLEPYIKKKTEKEEILQKRTEKLLADYIKKSKLDQKFDNKMLFAIYKKLHDKMTGDEDYENYEDNEEIEDYYTLKNKYLSETEE